MKSGQTPARRHEGTKALSFSQPRTQTRKELMHGFTFIAAASVFFGCASTVTSAAKPMIGFEAGRGLIVVQDGRTDAVVIVAPDARTWERRAADDLVHFIELMSGARPGVADSAAAVEAAKAARAPVLLVGRVALAADASLQAALDRVKKKDPFLGADAVVLRRDGNRVYLAGTNDRSHYYAISKLLHLWGCRWYIPTEFGQCIPQHATLTVLDLDYVYAPPFEVRKYWISWNGDASGAAEFRARNFMNERVVPSGHALAKYTANLAEQRGVSHMQIPITDPATAEHVAAKVDAQFAAGERFSLGMEDGIYTSDYERDVEYQAGLFDKYMVTPNFSDAFLTFYNNVCDIVLKRHPGSSAKIGFLAYSNITLPPQRDIKAAAPLVAYLAPIDIDPIHGMDDRESPPRQEYRQIMYRWAKVMQGRVVIYDYDQGMLVWRDIPNPSHQSFVQDVQHYRRAGILGVDTESRNAIGTTFINLHLRAQLLWDPDLELDAHLAEIYPKFYGPAAEPMRRYWTAIFDAWSDTIVTEHEFFLAPAIYTPRLVELLRGHLADANRSVAALESRPGGPTQREKLYLERMRFTKLSFDILDNYMAMVRSANSECDFASAVTFGEQGLTAREQLTEMSGIFTTYLRYPEHGPAWWPGEVEQYRQLVGVTNGPKGRLVKKLPLNWAFKRDPNDTGLPSGYAYGEPDLSYWHAHKSEFDLRSLKDWPTTRWEMLRTDQYMQAQGVRHPDRQSFVGHAWYHTAFELTDADVRGDVHVRFSGLFNDCWLYVNGHLVGHRTQKRMWWLNDYRFEWDLPLKGNLKPGRNTIVLRSHCKHHMGGMFRRPFLYEKLAGEALWRIEGPNIGT